MKTNLLKKKCYLKSYIIIICLFFCNQIVGQNRTYRIDNKDVSIDTEKLIDYMYLQREIEDISELEVEKVDNQYVNIMVNSPYREPEIRMKKLDINVLLIHNWWYGSKEEKDQIIEILRNGDKNGNTKATYILATYLCFETNNTTTFNEGAELMKKAADAGDKLACCEVGTFYCEGRPWGRNLQLAEKYLLSSCSQPAPLSYFNTAYLYDVYNNDLDKAEYYYKQCIETKKEQKYRENAYVNLTQLYANNNQAEKALETMKKGAEYGSIPCIGYYGQFLYYCGKKKDMQPTENDRKEGLEYLKKAADAGHTWSLIELNKILGNK